MPSKDLSSRQVQLGRHLHGDRLTARLSMDELAAAAGVTKSTVWRLEAGEIEAPSPTTLQRLARALGTEVEDYLALAGYFTSRKLPGLAPYLRAKYDVNDSVAIDVEDYLQFRLDQRRERDNNK